MNRQPPPSKRPARALLSSARNASNRGEPLTNMETRGLLAEIDWLTRELAAELTKRIDLQALLHRVQCYAVVDPLGSPSHLANRQHGIESDIDYALRNLDIAAIADDTRDALQCPQRRPGYSCLRSITTTAPNNQYYCVLCRRQLPTSEGLAATIDRLSQDNEKLWRAIHSLQLELEYTQELDTNDNGNPSQCPAGVPGVECRPDPGVSRWRKFSCSQCGRVVDGTPLRADAPATPDQPPADREPSEHQQQRPQAPPRPSDE